MEEAIIEDVFMQIQITLYILGLFEHHDWFCKYLSNTTSKSWFSYGEVHTIINWKHTLFKAEFLFNYITWGCIIAWLMYRHPNNWLVLYAFGYSYNLLRVMIDCQRFFFFRNRVNEWPARDLIIFSFLCMISPYSI